METIVLLGVTASNVFGIFPVISLIKTQRYYGVVLTLCAVVAFVFMHATETKHNLPGLFLANYSNIFLNIDRVIAYITGLYGMYMFLTNPSKKLMHIVVPLIGMTACGVGELTNNLVIYTGVHILWHILAYGSICLVNH